MTRDGGFLKVYGGMGFPVEKNSRDPLDALDADSAELLDSAPFPVDALPGACRTLVREAAASIGCPPDLVALPMLVVLGTASGNARRIKLKEGWKESAAIYGAAVAPPGEKKSAAYKVAVAPAVKRQAALRNAYREKMDEYERELREWEVEKRENGRNGLPEPPPPKEPVMERTVVEDATVEALVTVQQGTPRGVLVARDELAAWLRSMDQYRAGGKGSDRQFWLSVWSNAYASVDRKGRAEPLILQSPFVGVYGSIQPGVLPELGAGREDGLLDRFLFARTDPISSRWTDDEVSVEARDAYAELYDGLRGLDMPEDEHGDPDPVRVEFSPDAKAVFVETVDGHREEMEGPGFPARLRGPGRSSKPTSPGSR